MKLRSLIRAVRRRVMPFRPTSPQFLSAMKDLGPGKIAIDCGANIGLYTALMAKTGAEVHAFEPDPTAFKQLTARVGSLPNVRLYNAAVSDSAGEMKLFLHVDRTDDPVTHSQSSSLVAAKSNIDTANYVVVQVIDFAEFVRKLGAVTLLKVDIEGHEIEVMNHLLDQDLMGSIRYTFIELHDTEHPALKVPTDKLRTRLQTCPAFVDTTWI